MKRRFALIGSLLIGGGTCLALAALFYFSWMPSSILADVPWLPSWLGVMMDSPAWRDPRTALPCVVLGAGAGVFFYRFGPRVKTSLLFVLYALPVAAELGQMFLPKRTCSVWDVLWGWVGLTIGLLITSALRFWRERASSKNA